MFWLRWLGLVTSCIRLRSALSHLFVTFSGVWVVPWMIRSHLRSQQISNEDERLVDYNDGG